MLFKELIIFPDLGFYLLFSLLFTFMSLCLDKKVPKDQGLEKTSGEVV
jgi:hypothetical protein